MSDLENESLKKNNIQTKKKLSKPRKWNTPKRNIQTSNLENKTLRKDIPEPGSRKGRCLVLGTETSVSQ